MSTAMLTAAAPSPALRPTYARTLPVVGSYRLAETAGLGFGRQAIADFDGDYRMAFTVDGDHERAAAVEIRQPAPDGLVVTMTTDADPDVVAAQVARILSVDVDGRGFDELARRDRVIGTMVAAAPGLRPPQFCSPYEAAAWSIISARRPGVQAERVRRRLSAAHGTGLAVAGGVEHAFPTPTQLLGVTDVPGLPATAIPRLHAVAEAARAGELDISRLVALDPEEARLDVQRLPGIGPFYSGLIVYRALGLPDVLPLIEPRSRAALERAHGLGPCSDEEFTALARAWRPYRMWVTFLARATAGRVDPAAGRAPRSRGPRRS